MILYEIKFELSPFFLIFIPIFVLIIGGAFIERKVSQQLNLNVNLKLRKTSTIIGLIFIIAFLSLTLIFQIIIYSKTANLYKSGDYEVVEGYVENFDTGTYENFDINGIHFSYYNSRITQGYHTTKSNDGVISGDGQHLKIGYVRYGFSSDNIIVYIEELE